jgi:hypothetical protein
MGGGTYAISLHFSILQVFPDTNHAIIILTSIASSTDTKFRLYLWLLVLHLLISCVTPIILPVVFYGCETWSLTLWEKQTLKVFENRMMRIFGSKGEEVVGCWRGLNNEELQNFYTSPNVIKVINSRRMRWVGQ